MELDLSPRVNGSMLRDLPGRSVILIGINRGQLREGVYNLETSDKSIVQVMLPPNEHLDANQCAQLSGKVNHQGNVLECTRVILMSPNFDMENYDKAITLASSAKFAHLFNDN